jgi:aminopeptidase N
VILHEMAHMWFGNIVTLRWWDDLWLNESFAEFAANWVMVHATQHVDAWAVHLAYEKIRAYDTDQGPTSHPIRMPVPDVASAAATFDALTYSKGASSLQQLSAFLGEEDFRAGMATYFRRHAWGNTTLQDLVDELSAASGRDLDSWRQGWLETAGTDLIRLERTEDGFELVADGPGGAEPRPHVLDVAAYRRTTAGLERVACPRVELTGRRTRVELPPDADVYVPNDSDVTFARVRPEERTRDAFFELGGELTTPTARGIVAATAWDMLLNGEASTVETVGCITGILAHEPSPTIFEVMLDLAVTVAELWAPDAARPALQDGLAGVCRGLVGIPAMRQVALRGLARTVCGDEDLHWLEEQADGDVDLLWRVQARRAEVSGVLDEPALAALAAQDPDPDAGMRALGVRAALPDAATKAKVWDELVSGRVPVAYVYTLGKAFWRPGQDALLAPFAEKYLDRVPSLHRGGLLPAMVFTRWLFPVFGLNGDLVEWERALEADAAPVVRRVISERLDEVRRMVRARAS